MTANIYMMRYKSLHDFINCSRAELESFIPILIWNCVRLITLCLHCLLCNIDLNGDPGLCNKCYYFYFCTVHQLYINLVIYVHFQDVMVYSMIEDKDNPTDTDLFFLNPNTGVVTLRKVWDRGDKKEYRVNIQFTFNTYQ